MPIGYGYQASGEEGYVNWAEAAKGFTDMLAKENKRREDKKAAYDAEDRELANKLANPEYGQYKDGNDFISNYVDNMTKQRLIDSKLFKAGILKERDYVLKTNNAIDGTTTLFNLQKKYQEEYKGMMEGVNEGSLQAINNFNMSTIDGFADFSKTRAFLDPKSGQVKLAKLKMNPQTGIMEVTNDIIPVGTAMRNMSTRIATYNLDAQTTKDAANLGDLKTAIVQAATLSRAGSVTEYLNSPEMMEKTFPGGKEAADKFREAINNNVESYLALPYNLTSILTQNTGKYGADSFTTDRTLADKDKTKILLKIDPSTGLNTMDETGPHYKEQRKEAYDYAKTQLLSKIDREKKVQTSTGQLSDVGFSRYAFNKGEEEKKMSVDETARMYSLLVTGTPAEQLNSARALEEAGIPVTIDAKNKKMNIAGEEFKMEGNTKNFITSSGHVLRKLSDKLGVPLSTILNRSREFAGNKGFSYNDVAANVVPTTTEANPYNDFVKDVDSSIPSSIFSKTEGNAIPGIIDVIEKYNLTAEETTPGQDYIKIKTKGAVPDEIELSFDESDPTEQARQKKRLMDFIRRVGKSELRLEGDEVTTPVTAPKPGPPKPAPRPGG
jgi:hypothetical protein